MRDLVQDIINLDEYIKDTDHRAALDRITDRLEEALGINHQLRAENTELKNELRKMRYFYIEGTLEGFEGGSMIEEQRIEFEAITRPVIEWLNNNYHPHVTVIISTTHAELSEGVCAYETMDYVKG